MNAIAVWVLTALAFPPIFNIKNHVMRLKNGRVTFRVSHALFRFRDYSVVPRTSQFVPEASVNTLDLSLSARNIVFSLSTLRKNIAENETEMEKL